MQTQMKLAHADENACEAESEVQVEVEAKPRQKAEDRHESGEFDNAGGMMSVDETLMCSFQILKPSEKKAKYQYGGMNTGRPVTPPRTAALGTGPPVQQGLNPALAGASNIKGKK